MSAPMNKVDLDEFLLRGTLGPINRRTHRSQLSQYLGPEDPGNYPALAVFSHVAFQYADDSKSIMFCHVNIPHSVHERSPAPYFDDLWTRPDWLECWPDPRFGCSMGIVQPNSTFESLCKQAPILSSAKRTDEWGPAFSESCDAYKCQSDVIMIFEASENVPHCRTLSRLVTSLVWQRQ
jgi:hypothetical protein